MKPNAASSLMSGRSAAEPIGKKKAAGAAFL
jgi:hypothetical protein